MDTSPTPTEKTSMKKKYIAISAALLVLLAIIAVAVWLTRQPSPADFEEVQSSLITDVTKTQSELTPQLNNYLESFKKHQSETGSIDQAVERSKADFDAFKQTEAKARETLNRLADSKAQHDGSVGPAIDQLVAIYEEQTNFYAGLVSGYADAQRLFFGDNNTICRDILIGNRSESISQRQELLNEAVGNCFEAINTLKTAGNEPYADFAKKVERRINQMQKSVAVVAKAERDHATFTAERDQLVREAAEAQARNASDAEYQQITNKAKALEKEIRQSTAGINSSRKGYVSAVESLPGLYESIFKTEVPTKLEYFAAISDARLKALELIIEEKVERP